MLVKWPFKLFHVLVVDVVVEESFAQSWHCLNCSKFKPPNHGRDISGLSELPGCGTAFRHPTTFPPSHPPLPLPNSIHLRAIAGLSFVLRVLTFGSKAWHNLEPSGSHTHRKLTKAQRIIWIDLIFTQHRGCSTLFIL